jgi:hypothetical protein
MQSVKITEVRAYEMCADLESQLRNAERLSKKAYYGQE